VRSEPAGAPPPAPSRDDLEIHGRRVLVVDDNVDAAESTAAFLRLEGHEVKTVADGAQALASLNVFDPHVVVLDIGCRGSTVSRSLAGCARAATPARRC
jgi:two-component system CheB/CheR fusion protein